MTSFTSDDIDPSNIGPGDEESSLPQSFPMVNAKTNLVEPIESDKIAQMLAAGSHVFRDGARALISPEGALDIVPAQNIQKALAAFGYREPTQQDLNNHADKERLGQGFKAGALAFGAGALRGAGETVFAPTDVALVKSGLVDANTLKKLKEFWPGVSMAGELTGLGAATMATPYTGLGVVGRAAEAVGTKAPFLRSLAGTMARWGAEGAAMQAPHEWNEQALGDPNAAAESIFPKVVEAGLVNAGFGAMFKGLGWTGSKLLDKAKGSYAKLSEAMFGKIVPADTIKTANDILTPDVVETIQKVTESKTADEALIKVGAMVKSKSTGMPFQEVMNTTPPDELRSVGVEITDKLKGKGKDKLAKELNEIKDSAVSEPSVETPENPGQTTASTSASDVVGGKIKIPDLTQRPEGATIFDPGGLLKMGAAIHSKMFNKDYQTIIEEMRGLGSGRILGADERNAHVQKLVDGLQSVYNDSEKIAHAMYQEVRDTEVNKYLNIPITPSMTEFIHNINEGVDNVVAKMEANESIIPAALPKTINTMWEETIENLKGAKTAADTQRAILNFRKKLDTKINWNTYPKWTAAAGGDIVKDLRTSIKQGLHDASIWGDYAARQASIDDAYNTWKTTMFDRKSIFKQELMKKMGITKSGRPIWEINPRYVNEVANMINNARGIPRLKAMTEGLRAFQRLIDELEAIHQGAEVPFNRSPLDQSLETNINDIQEAKNIIAGQPGMGHGFFTDAQTMGFGLAVHSKLGAALGGIKAASRVVQDPLNVADKIARMRKAQARTEQKMGSKTKEVFDHVTQKTEFKTPKVDKPLSDEEIKNLRDETLSKTMTPEKMVETTTNATKDLTPIAPRISQAMHIMLIKAMNMLKDSIPQEQKDSAFSPEKPLSQSQKYEFQKFYDVLHDPMKIYDEVMSGHVSPQSLTVMENIYPIMLDKMRTMAFDELSKRVENGEQINYQHRLALRDFLGLDLDKMATPVSLNSNQQLYNTASAQKKAREQSLMQPKGNQKGMAKIDVAQRSAPFSHNVRHQG